MRKREKEVLLIAFLKEKIRYEKLGDYILLLIKDDPSAPKNNFHTITHRIKEEKRFIEKIERERKEGYLLLALVHENKVLQNQPYLSRCQWHNEIWRRFSDSI